MDGVGDGNGSFKVIDPQVSADEKPGHEEDLRNV